MRILLDQCTPRGLIDLLVGHDTVSAASLGWSELTNGRPLATAGSAGFDAFITSDKNLRYQQNLTGRRIAVIVLSTNNWRILRDGSAKILEALSRAVDGSYEGVLFPRPSLVRRNPAR